MEEHCYSCFLEVLCAEFQNNAGGLASKTVENDLELGSGNYFAGLGTRVSFASKVPTTQAQEPVFSI